MSVGIEALFTSALGLQAPWSVEKVELDTARRRIDFELTCKANRLSCPHCQTPGQGVHDRIKREWRHLDFFQYEAWLHAEVPRIACTACGKTTQMDVPWAREGSGFTALFEALALSLCQRVLVLDHGRVVADGEPRSVLTGELIAQVWGVGASFLSTPDGRHVIIPEENRAETNG